jgi:hypothetical protein
MTDKIKDLNVGDSFTGKIRDPEITVEGDTVNASWVETAGLTGNITVLDAEIASIDKDIAHRQENRALRVAMRTALIAKLAEK